MAKNPNCFSCQAAVHPQQLHIQWLLLQKLHKCTYPAGPDICIAYIRWLQRQDLGLLALYKPSFWPEG